MEISIARFATSGEHATRPRIRPLPTVADVAPAAGVVEPRQPAAKMPVMTNVPDDDVAVATGALIARRGRAARQQAAARAAEFERLACWPEHTLAGRVLTAVENLLDQKPA